MDWVNIGRYDVREVSQSLSGYYGVSGAEGSVGMKMCLHKRVWGTSPRISVYARIKAGYDCVLDWPWQISQVARVWISLIVEVMQATFSCSLYQS